MPSPRRSSRSPPRISLARNSRPPQRREGNGMKKNFRRVGTARCAVRAFLVLKNSLTRIGTVNRGSGGGARTVKGSWKGFTFFDAHWAHEPSRKMYLPLPTVFWGERETGRGGALPQ